MPRPYLTQVERASERHIRHLIRDELIRELIGLAMTDVLTQTSGQLEKHQVASPEQLQLLPENVVSYSPTFHPKVRALKKFLFERMYHHYRLVRMQQKAERFLSQLFKAYIKEPKMLPTETQEQLEDKSIHQVVTNYIAGMTDRYALDEWEKLFTPYGRV